VGFPHKYCNTYHHISTFASKGLDKVYWEDISDILNDNNKGAKPYPVKLCADKLMENYKKIYCKLKILSEVDKKYNLEKIFQGEIYTENSRLFGMLEQYKFLNNRDGRAIKHIEIVTLQYLCGKPTLFRCGMDSTTKIYH